MKASEVDLAKEWVKELAARRQAAKKIRDAEKGFNKKYYLVTDSEHDCLKKYLIKIRKKK